MEKLRFRVMAALLGILLLGGSVWAAAESEAVEKKIQLELWNCDAAPMYTDLFTTMIAEYESLNPNVEIVFTDLPWDISKQKFDTAIATDSAPDVGHIVHSWVGSFAAMDGLYPLDEYFDAWKEKDDYDLRFFNLEYLFMDGNRYSVPVETLFPVIWYNKSRYEEKGLTVPADFDEFFYNIEQLTDLSKEQYGFTIRGGGGSTKMLDAYLVSYVGADSYFDENGKCVLNSPKAAEGLKRFVKLYKNNTPESDIVNGYRQMVAVFGSGTAASVMHNLTSMPMHRENLGEGNFANYILPPSDNGNHVINMCGVASTAGFSIFKSSKNPDSAWDFIKFMINQENMQRWSKTLGVLPVHKGILEESWFNEDENFAYAKDVFMNDDIIITLSPLHLPDYDAIHLNILEPGFQELLLGKKTAESFLQDWAEAFEKANQEFLNR
jgi:multiple sugar transport system substrate-binding protein